MRRFPTVPACAIALAAGLVACESGPRPAGDSASAAGAAGADGVTTVTPADSACAPAPLADSAAGPVRLGMPVEQLRARCPGTRDTTVAADEGMRERTILVPVGRDTLMASIVDDRVWRIAVTTPGIRTRDSLGVGTRLSRLLEMPGARGIAGEGRSFVIADVPCGLSFQLDATATGEAEIRGLPGGTRVKRVLVTGCGGPP